MNTNSATPSSTIADPTVADPIRPTVANRKVPAWLLSCGLHSIILIALILLLGQFKNGAGDVEHRKGGIVLVEVTSPETTEYLSEGDNADTTSASAAAQQSPPPLPSTDELPPDLPGVASSPSELTGIGDDLMESMPGADALLDGNENVQIGGKVTTEVFGVKGTGSKFLYVFDRSDSMEGYERRPLLAARAALKASLASLGSNHQFQIVFYNNETRVFKLPGEGARMYFANDDNKAAGNRFVDSVAGSGGTNHLAALKYALSLGPDVIFLLTDAEGGFTPAELGAVSDWNRSAAIINAVEFGVGAKPRASDRSLERLATESGGQYVYKNILTLQLER